MYPELSIADKEMFRIIYLISQEKVNTCNRGLELLKKMCAE